MVAGTLGCGFFRFTNAFWIDCYEPGGGAFFKLLKPFKYERMVFQKKIEMPFCQYTNWYLIKVNWSAMEGLSYTINKYDGSTCI
jgi:hypothetical protein